MCCNTKEKIAAAVKSLMRQKSIRKITVQDIMDETGMKRQSFYYHFQDIYNVIEWICSRELIYKIDVEQETSFEEWLRDLMETIEADRCFYKKDGRESKRTDIRTGRTVLKKFPGSTKKFCRRKRFSCGLFLNIHYLLSVRFYYR